jgi:hypothetical protein
MATQIDNIHNSFLGGIIVAEGTLNSTTFLNKYE